MTSPYEQTSEARSIMEVEAGGSAVEAVGGLGVIVLSILGLAGIAPNFLASIAGIIFGVAIFAHGAAVAAEYSKLLSQISEGRIGGIELGGGMAIEFLAGIATVVLGILAVVGKYPTILMASLIIVGGAALILSSGTMQRLNDLKAEANTSSEFERRVFRAAVSGASVAQILAGVATVVLGILALVFQPAATLPAEAMVHPLTLVGLLVMGSAITLSGALLTGKFLSILSHR